MRSTSLVLAALTGLAVSAFAAPAGALTPVSGAGVGTAAQSVDPVASVHCRPYKHRSYNHGWGFGCRGGAHVSIYEREGRGHRRGFEEREGRARVGVHERSSTRSETDVRSRERTTTGRSHEGSSVRGEAKGGTSGSSTKGGSGTTGNRSETGGTSGGGTKSGGGGTSGQNSGTKQ
jgi:hypothetical protein